MNRADWEQESKDGREQARIDRERWRPLVVDLTPSKSSNKSWAWIRGGAGHVLAESDGRWWPISEAPGIGGRVLSEVEVAQLVERFGAPPVAQ